MDSILFGIILTLLILSFLISSLSKRFYLNLGWTVASFVYSTKYYLIDKNTTWAILWLVFTVYYIFSATALLKYAFPSKNE